MTNGKTKRLSRFILFSKVAPRLRYKKILPEKFGEYLNI